MKHRPYGSGQGGGGVSFYLSPDDLKKLDKLRKALGVEDRFLFSRSLTVSKLIQNTYAQLFPPSPSKDASSRKGSSTDRNHEAST